MTRKLSHRRETISSILPVYQCLINSLRTNSDTDMIKQFKRTLSDGLKSRMQTHLSEKYSSKKL